MNVWLGLKGVYITRTCFHDVGASAVNRANTVFSVLLLGHSDLFFHLSALMTSLFIIITEILSGSINVQIN